MSMLCALSLPLFLGSCAQKAENNQQCENEVKTEEVKAMTTESGVFLYENDVQWEPAGENVALRVVLTVFSACTYVMIASAAMRMLLYVDAYSLSFLRILVLWFLLECR